MTTTPGLAREVMKCSVKDCVNLANGSKKLALCNAHYSKYRMDNCLGVYGRHQLTCAHCGKNFRSRDRKKYCCLRCYVTSPEAKALLAEAGLKGASMNTGRQAGVPEKWTCLECSTEKMVTLARQKKKRFCNSVCYRAYMSKRFDRFIANPETIALPQCYDEFLDREELPCLVEGCDWRGKNLSCHMNFTHGIRADKFKELAGFNRRTGVISKDLAEAMQARWQQWNGPGDAPQHGHVPPRSQAGTIRPEGREHLVKAHALYTATALRSGNSKYRQDNPDWREKLAEAQRDRAAKGEGAYKRISSTCTVCGRNFKATSAQATRPVRICSKECRRQRHHETFVQRAIWPMTCAQCGRQFLGTYSRHKSTRRGLPTYCSKECRYTRPRISSPPPAP